MKKSHVALVLALSLLTSCISPPTSLPANTSTSLPPGLPTSLPTGAPETGKVLVRFVVTEQGSVEDTAVVSSTHAAFNQAAVDAVSNWKFKPGIKSGKPVRTTMVVPIFFELNNDQKPVLSVQSEPHKPTKAR